MEGMQSTPEEKRKTNNSKQDMSSMAMAMSDPKLQQLRGWENKYHSDDEKESAEWKPDNGRKLHLVGRVRDRERCSSGRQVER